MNNSVGRNAVLWAVATLLMLPAFVTGHIIADSSYLNVNWSDGFTRELFSGQLYPRWLPEMSAGAGSPVFYFYGPLPFYLISPFHLIAGPRLAVVLGIWMMLGASGQAFFALAFNFVRNAAALAGSIAYMVMPYHLLVDIWLRTDLGELAMYIFIPLCVLGAFRLGKDKRAAFVLAAGLAGMLLSHLPLALLFSPMFAAICIYATFREKAGAVLFRAAAAAFLSLGVAAAYVFPALIMQRTIHASRWDIYRPAESLLFAGHPTTFERFLDGNVVCSAIVLVAFSAISIASRQWRTVAPWMILAMTVIVLVLPPGAIVWNAAPTVFDRVQFAWRGFALLDFAICMVFAFALDRGVWRAFVIGLICLLIVAMSVLFFVFQIRNGDAGFIHRSPVTENELIAVHAEPIEYLPSCLRLAETDLNALLSVLIVRRSLTEKPQNEVPVFYYPFLDIYVNGAPVVKECDTRTGFAVVGPHVGRVDVVARTTTAELSSYAISALSILVLLLGILGIRANRLTDRL